MMKKLLSILLLVALPLLACGQDASFDKLYDKYTDKHGFTTVEITSALMQLIANDTAKTFGEIEYIKIISSETESPVFVEEIKKIPKIEGYKLMTSINEDGEHIRFYYKEKNNRISSFLTIIYGEEDNLIVNIVGDLDIKKISNLSELSINMSN